MGRDLEITDFLSFKLYPKVFTDAYNKHLKFGNVMNIPTKNFFFGLDEGEEIMVDIESGKKVLISLVHKTNPDENGNVTVFFKINGQMRVVAIKDNSITVDKVENVKVDPNDESQIGAPLQGLLSSVLVKEGDIVQENQPLFIIEAMKMETTVTAVSRGIIEKVQLSAGTLVDTNDLVIKIK